MDGKRARKEVQSLPAYPLRGTTAECPRCVRVLPHSVPHCHTDKLPVVLQGKCPHFTLEKMRPRGHVTSHSGLQWVPHLRPPGQVTFYKPLPIKCQRTYKWPRNPCFQKGQEARRGEEGAVKKRSGNKSNFPEQKWSESINWSMDNPNVCPHKE